jgi:hypothetical protein
MPSIFDDHNAKQSLARIVAAKSDNEINIADAKAMHAKLGDLIKAHEQATSSAAKRAAKLDAALSDPARQPAINYASGVLRRLGLDFATAASNPNVLTESMRKANMTTTQRIEIRKVLADLGVTD